MSEIAMPCAPLAHRLGELSPYALLVVGQWKEAVAARGLTLCDLSLGDPKEATPAFIRERLVHAVTPSSSYPPAHGTLGLRAAAAGWLHRRLGTDYPQERVVPTSGSKEGIFHFAQVLEPGLAMGFPVPGYPVYESAAIVAGHRAVPVPLRAETGFALEVADVADLGLGALWVCSPHNPTGTVLSREQMQRLLDWTRSQGILLLSDECYLDSLDPGSAQPVSFLELSRGQGFKGVVSFFTLSKRSGMTGYRSGFVAGDPVYIEAFQKYRPHAGLASPSFVQEAATVAWSDDDHVQKRAVIYAEKRAVVRAFLQSQGWPYVQSDATFYVWSRLPDEYPDARGYLEQLALATGIVATPGDCFGASDQVAKWFRIALVPPVAELHDGLVRWAEFEKQKGSHRS